MNEQTTGLTENAEPVTETATETEKYDRDAPILPKGWDGESDIFQLKPAETEDPLVEKSPDDADSGVLNDESPEVPTTDENGESQNNPTDGEENPATESAEATPPKRELTLKVNHEERVVDVNAMTDEEIISLFQRGYAYDNLKAVQQQRADAEKFREFVQSKVPALMDRGDDAETAAGIAAMMARNKGIKAFPIDISDDGKITLSNEIPLPEDPISPSANAAQESKAAPKQEAQPQKQSYEDQLRAFLKANPNFGEIPERVSQLMKFGYDFNTAMLTYRQEAMEKRTAKVAKQNKILKQNADAARRAPVKGVSGGGAGVEQKKTMRDILIQGLREG